ncbi:retinol-binding protein pinta-like [Haematobia irritans]|uniref:retinol-binding protein pinta-like n=1 Tax=Haematobia irritans TaxID=7368 RepID=UPI003F50AD8B
MAGLKPLPEELQRIVIKELGEVPNRISEDLQTFKTWIKQQPHLKARMDDQFLIQFLRGCKYSLEKAKQKIDMFYTMKTRYPEFFNGTDVDSEQFRKLHNTRFYTVLPTPLNETGSRIVVVRFNYAYQDFNALEIFRYGEAIVEVMLMHDPYACVNGITAIIDMADASANHLMQFSITSVRKFATFHEKVFPVRSKLVVFINLSKYSYKFFNMILPHLPEKLRKRTIFCETNTDEIVQHLPRKYLPQEYGGLNGSIDHLGLEYNKVWDENREFFKENLKYGTDESLRTGKPPINFDGDLGMAGNFRKLDVD